VRSVLPEDFSVLASGDLYGDIKAGPLQAKLPRRRHHIVSWNVRREGVTTAVSFTTMVNEPAGFSRLKIASPSAESD
jgi:hypothetical protein